MNNRKQVMGIIEHDVDLDAFLMNHIVSIPAAKKYYRATSRKLSIRSKYIYWLSSSGLLKGINCTWIQEISLNNQWKSAIQVSIKNNILAFKCNPETIF
jgi:hypothetical protein